MGLFTSYIKRSQVLNSVAKQTLEAKAMAFMPRQEVEVETTVMFLLLSP